MSRSIDKTSVGALDDGGSGISGNNVDSVEAQSLPVCVSETGRDVILEYNFCVPNAPCFCEIVIVAIFYTH